MDLKIKTIHDGVYLIEDAFSQDECSQLIERSEGIGFEAASVRTAGGPSMNTNIRNNERVVLDDFELANQMWERVGELLPRIDGQDACGVSTPVKFYKYKPGQRFKRHMDGSSLDGLGNQSQLSYLVYLNDGFEGGSTIFFDNEKVFGMRPPLFDPMKPKLGSALLFRHKIWHEGEEVISGTKYILRSDVVYAK